MRMDFQTIKQRAAGALRDCMDLRETVWINPDYEPYEKVREELLLPEKEINEALRYMEKSGTLLGMLFPQLSGMTAPRCLRWLR